MRTPIIALSAIILLVSCGPGDDPVGPSTGALSVVATGLPPGTTTSFQVTGPRGFAAPVIAGDMLDELAPGSYTVTPAQVTSEGNSYSAPTQVVSVAASTTPTIATVDYAIVRGSLSVTVTGLPAGASAAITVTGPDGYSRPVTATETIASLMPGSYTVTATPVTSGGHQWTPSPASRTVMVSSGVTASAPVAYSQSTGSLAVTISGLPGGTNAAVTVTGPNGYTRQVTASETIAGLAPGTYTITAAAVTAAGQTYTGSPASQTASVTAASTVSRAVSYSTGPAPTINLWIDGMYVTQGSQTYGRSVPLIQGRNGLLRVFVRANQANTVAPQVRVRVYENATLRQTYTINAPESSVPLGVNESPLTRSWNVAIPGSLIGSGLRILADVDPANAIAETNESDNRFPANGTPLSLEVRTAPIFRTRLVPVHTSVDGRTGNVSSSNQSDYTSFAMAVFPFPGIESAIRATYTTTAGPLQSSNGNNAWSTILSEIRALRTSDGDSRHYYGVVNPPYSGGIAGMGYLGFPSAIGYDRSGNRGWVAAHEWGHNFNRRHAPCGGASSTDPSYPYPGGKIGVFGYDLVPEVLRDTTMADLMGYCSSRWISDYTYSAVMAYRGMGTMIAGESTQGGASLLVWGRVQDGVLTLEPAFELARGAQLPEPGPYRLELLDVSGAPVGTWSFAAHELSHSHGREEHFAFSVPLTAAVRDRLVSLRITGPGVAATAQATAMAGAPSVPLSMTTMAAAAVTITWDAAAYPVVMIRDPRTGEVLSFARGGQVTLPTTATELDVHLSDRVRSRIERVRR